jgi:hypothetical protein
MGRPLKFWRYSIKRALESKKLSWRFGVAIGNIRAQYHNVIQDLFEYIIRVNWQILRYIRLESRANYQYNDSGKQNKSIARLTDKLNRFLSLTWKFGSASIWRTEWSKQWRKGKIFSILNWWNYNSWLE